MTTYVCAALGPSWVKLDTPVPQQILFRFFPTINCYSSTRAITYGSCTSEFNQDPAPR